MDSRTATKSALTNEAAIAVEESAHAQPDHIIVLTSFTNDEHNLSKPFYLHFAEIMQIIRIFV